MIDRDILLILIGAGIALIASLASAVLQHFLSLRAEKTKLDWAREEKKAEERKRSLLLGVPGVTDVQQVIASVRGKGRIEPITLFGDEIEETGDESEGAAVQQRAPLKNISTDSETSTIHNRIEK